MILPVLGHYRAAPRRRRPASSGTPRCTRPVSCASPRRSGPTSTSAAAVGPPGYSAPRCRRLGAGLAADLGDDNIRARVLTVLAYIDAPRGDAQACREHPAAGSTSFARQLGPRSNCTPQRVGAQAFTAGHHHEAARRADDGAQEPRRHRARAPRHARAAEDLIEALHHSGESATRPCDLLYESPAPRPPDPRTAPAGVAVLRARIVLGLVDEQLLVTANEARLGPGRRGAVRGLGGCSPWASTCACPGCARRPGHPCVPARSSSPGLRARPWVARGGEALRAAAASPSGLAAPRHARPADAAGRLASSARRLSRGARSL